MAKDHHQFRYRPTHTCCTTYPKYAEVAEPLPEEAKVLRRLRILRYCTKAAIEKMNKMIGNFLEESMGQSRNVSDLFSDPNPPSI